MNASIPWLVEQDLPRVPGEDLDVRYTPASSVRSLAEARASARVLVTQNPILLKPGALPPRHPGVVVVEGDSCTPEGLRRNLLHFQFCLLHRSDSSLLEGQRFVLRLDRAIYRILPEGTTEEVEGWKVPMKAPVPAYAAPG